MTQSQTDGRFWSQTERRAIQASWQLLVLLV